MIEEDIVATVHDLPDKRLNSVAFMLVLETPTWSRTAMISRQTGEEIHSSVITDEAASESY